MGYDALACDNEERIEAAIRERGLPSLILSDSPEQVSAARAAVPRLFNVGSYPAMDFLRADARTRELLLTG
jgi:hypothetical protein